MPARDAGCPDFDAPNLAALMFERAARWGARPMLRAAAARGVEESGWRRISWAEFARQAASLARHLRGAGIAAGDRVLIVSENRPEVPVAEVALMAIRAVPVPAYTTNTVADHAHVLRDSGARVAIVSSAVLAAKVALAGHLDLLVAIEGFQAPGVQTLPWAALVADRLPPDDIAAEAAMIPPSTLACLIYTSGTGGEPKGVMLPHRSILANCRGALPVVRALGLGPDEVYLSFLPLSHAFEHTVGQFIFPALGVEVAYARGAEHLAADMLAVQPTLMTMVPRVLELIRARILAAVARETRLRRALFDAAMQAGYRALDGRANLLDRLLDPLWERLIRRKLRARFGGRFRAAVSGGARLDPEVGRFFLALGIKLLQGYGQTEAGPVIAVNPPDRTRIETVGPPLAGVEVRIAPDGEILVRGELVMDGYWRRPEETAEVLREGWLATGDVGELDADGYLFITDRKKDMIVLSGGENVSPARIEAMLVNEPAIAQAMVLGEGSAGLRALVVAAEGCDEAAVAAAVSDVNKRLAVVERIRRHVVVAPFTHDNGQLTVTQKVRRHMVAAAHAAELGDGPAESRAAAPRPTDP